VPLPGAAYRSMPCWSTSPNFLHFVWDRHLVLPSGVAKVTRPSTYTESLSPGAKHLEVPKQQGCPKCAEVKRIHFGYQVDSVVGTCLSGAFGSSASGMHALKMSDWSAFGLFGKYRTRRFQHYLGQTEEWKALKLSGKAANVPKWARRS
jgi:hypothetical protein